MPKKIPASLFLCLSFLAFQARGGDDLAKLGKARVDAAAKAYKVFFDEGRREGLLSGYHASVRWLHAELDLATKKEERTAAYANHLQRVKDWRKKVLGGVDQLPRGKDEPASIFSVFDALELEAQYWLAKERAGK